MYVIIKNVKRKKGPDFPVIVLGAENEILEFETQGEAEKMKEIFQKNSDSGHIYEVKKI